MIKRYINIYIELLFFLFFSILFIILNINLTYADNGIKIKTKEDYEIQATDGKNIYYASDKNNDSLYYSSINIADMQGNPIKQLYNNNKIVKVAGVKNGYVFFSEFENTNDIFLRAGNATFYSLNINNGTKNKICDFAVLDMTLYKNFAIFTNGFYITDISPFELYVLNLDDFSLKKLTENMSDYNILNDNIYYLEKEYLDNPFAILDI